MVAEKRGRKSSLTTQHKRVIKKYYETEGTKCRARMREPVPSIGAVKSYCRKHGLQKAQIKKLTEHNKEVIEEWYRSEGTSCVSRMKDPKPAPKTIRNYAHQNDIRCEKIKMPVNPQDPADDEELGANYMPTQEEIEEVCLDIQQTWSEAERMRRAQGVMLSESEDTRFPGIINNEEKE